MRVTVAGLNMLLGIVYMCIGVITLVEMKREWKTMGYSHFGATFVGLAFTCGPHHLVHGLHIGFTGRHVGVLELAYVLIGLPPGAIWFLLRVEAFKGGRGDRFISGTPRWVAAAPAAAVLYAGAFVAASIFVLRSGSVHLKAMVAPNVLLVGIYVTIGYFLFKTQVRNRPQLGGWSVSGISLGALFPTCAMMHMVMVVYGLSGLYAFDVHGSVIDWISVPTGLYFLWVVHGLYRESLRDWNHTIERPAILVG